MKRRYILLFVSMLFFLGFAIAEVSAKTDNYPSYYYFGYGNGTYFTHLGTYGNVTEINHVWYFDDVAYPSTSSTPSPSSAYPSVPSYIASSLYTNIGFLWVLPFILAAVLVLSAVVMFRSGTFDTNAIVVFVVAAITVEVGCIIVVVIVNTLSGV